MFKKIKDFFTKETDWGFPWKNKASRFSQWYTFGVCMVGVYMLSTWMTLGGIALIEKIEDRKCSKIKKEIMEEEETE